MRAIIGLEELNHPDSDDKFYNMTKDPIFKEISRYLDLITAKYKEADINTYVDEINNTITEVVSRICDFYNEKETPYTGVYLMIDSIDPSIVYYEYDDVIVLSSGTMSSEYESQIVNNIGHYLAFLNSKGARPEKGKELIVTVRLVVLYKDYPLITINPGDLDDDEE